MDRSARTRLAPRLVLIFAVLACVFGWGQSIAAAASPAQPSAPPSLAAPAHASSASDAAVHPPASEAFAMAEQPVDEATHGQADEQGHAGHGSGHEHSVSCMASSATAAFGAAAASDVAALVVSAIPSSLTQVRDSALGAGAQHAPSIATFCVLRT